jgi:hypothetical protein
MNYLITHMWPQIDETQRASRIMNWIDGHDGRIQVLGKIIELSLRKRDEAEAAHTDSRRTMLLNEEFEIRKKLEKLIENEST